MSSNTRQMYDRIFTLPSEAELVALHFGSPLSSPVSSPIGFSSPNPEAEEEEEEQETSNIPEAEISRWSADSSLLSTSERPASSSGLGFRNSEEYHEELLREVSGLYFYISPTSSEMDGQSGSGRHSLPESPFASEGASGELPFKQSSVYEAAAGIFRLSSNGGSFWNPFTQQRSYPIDKSQSTDRSSSHSPTSPIPLLSRSPTSPPHTLRIKPVSHATFHLIKEIYRSSTSTGATSSYLSSASPTTRFPYPSPSEPSSSPSDALYSPFPEHLLNIHSKVLSSPTIQLLVDTDTHPLKSGYNRYFDCQPHAPRARCGCYWCETYFAPGTMGKHDVNEWCHCWQCEKLRMQIERWAVNRRHAHAQAHARRQGKKISKGEKQKKNARERKEEERLKECLQFRSDAIRSPKPVEVSREVVESQVKGYGCKRFFGWVRKHLRDEEESQSGSDHELEGDD